MKADNAGRGFGRLDLRVADEVGTAGVWYMLDDADGDVVTDDVREASRKMARMTLANRMCKKRCADSATVKMLGVCHCLTSKLRPRRVVPKRANAFSSVAPQRSEKDRGCPVSSMAYARLSRKL